jgi:hypothetical protein
MGGNPPAMLLLDFVPVLVCAGWVLLYAEPHANWFRNHVSRWSGDIGIRGVVHDVSMWNGVLAFGIGLVFAYTVEPGMLGRRHTVVATEPAPMDEPVADEPTLAERQEAAATDSDTRNIERTRTTVR